MTKFGPKLAFFCPLQANLVPCCWVGWWLWRGLYLARHLFILCNLYFTSIKSKDKTCPDRSASVSLILTNRVPMGARSNHWHAKTRQPVGDNFSEPVLIWDVKRWFFCAFLQVKKCTRANIFGRSCHCLTLALIHSFIHWTCISCQSCW